MVWSIIANGVVYVKYKHAYKIKLMVLNGWLFPASPCGCSHDTRLEHRLVKAILVYFSEKFNF